VGPAFEIKRRLKTVRETVFQLEHLIPTSVCAFTFASTKGEPIIKFGAALWQGIGTIKITPEIFIGVSRRQKKQRADPQCNDERPAKNKRSKKHVLPLS